MLIVGLTGNLSTGKSTVARLFRKKGAKVLDADKIAKTAFNQHSACFERIVKNFGREVLTGKGVDRKKLAQIVFNNKKKRAALEKIIHPYVRSTMNRAIKKMAAENKGVVVLDVPLLFESGFDRMADCTVVVGASQHKQIQRAKKNLNITATEALKRIASQWPLSKKIRLADYYIDNNDSLNKTEGQVKVIWEKLTQKKKK